MIPIKNEVNYKINWHAVRILEGLTPEQDIELQQKILTDRKHYFQMLRKLLTDLSNLELAEVSEILNKHGVHFVDIDDFPRVNLDEPKQ